MPPAKKKLTAGTDWIVPTLRCTVFAETPLDDPGSWWKDLTGEPPEQDIRRPKESLIQQEGVVDGKKLILVIQLNRITWQLFASEKDLGEQDEVAFPPTVGTLAQASEKLIALINPWFKQSPPVSRLAFGCTLHRKVRDMKEGYRALNELLPAVNVDYRNSSDFLYRINRWRKSKTGVPDLRINRLSTWSVVRQFREMVTIPDSSMTRSLRLMFTACQLELDINTVPEHSEILPQEALPDIFDELVGFGREIAKKGDVK